MLKTLRNTILVLLVLGALGVVTKMVEEPNKYWVLDQISIHNGQILDVSEDEIAFDVDGVHVYATWKGAEDYFKDLND